jgi:hypothetical protein
MASVQAVYNTLKDVVNKEQRGFVTPAMFNNFAQVAQLNVYNKLFIIMGTSTRVPIELCYDESKIDRILISDLSAPSTSHPVALVGEDIEVFPSSIQRIRLRYYKYPQGRTMAGARSPNQPNYAVTAINGNDTFDTANSIDFELPDHYLSDLVYEVAQLAGLSIRDNNVINLMQQEEAENQRDRTF